MAGWLNLGVPWFSAVRLLRSVVSPIAPPLPIWRWERGARRQKNIRKFGRIPPKCGGFHVGLAKFRRSATFRIAPRGSVFCLWTSDVAYPPPSPIGRWGWGCPAPEILWNLGGARQHSPDPRAAWPNFGAPPRSVDLRGAPFVFGSFAFPTSPNGCWGMGVSGAKNIGKFGRLPPKFAGFQGGAAKFRRSVTFRGVPWGSEVCLSTSIVSFPPPSLIGCWGRVCVRRRKY